MKHLLLLLIAYFFSFYHSQAAGITNGTDTVSSISGGDSLDTRKNIVQIRQLKFEILRRLRDDRYAHPGLRASIDSGIVSLAGLTDSIQKTTNKDEILDCKLYLGYLLADLINDDIPSEKSWHAIRGYLSVRQLLRNRTTIFPTITQLDPAFTHPILRSIRKKDAPGWAESTDYLVCQTFVAHPRSFLRMAFDYPDADCIDTLLPLIAKQQPDELYKFAQATTSVLGKKIAASHDALVKLIAKIAGMPQGRVYYPFLDDLYHKKRSIAEIDKAISGGNRVGYYQLLVKTAVVYNDRVSRGDTPIAMNGLTDKVAYSAEMDFVRVINSLHGSSDGIRLKVLARLTPQELYYLCINGEKDLYTSSYLKIYNAIFAGQRKLNTYKLLESLHFDHFRRFIKMAGTYNTLDDFLSRMTKEEAGTVMHSFIDGLNTNTSLEEVIDVANSYASIRNDSLRNFILNEVADNMKSESQTGTKSPRIYTLLNTLFLSLDPSNNINLATALGIPDVYQLTQNSLKDSSGQIIIQQFFYGDADGKTAYNTFVQWLRENHWKINTTKYWIEAVSGKNSNIRLFANLPLNDNTNQAEIAQSMLHDHLSTHSLYPSIVIHRGHSYFANHTITQLGPTNKLVIMGSCGSFSQISKIYKYSPHAQMISTRQEGSVTVNQPMIGYILDQLVAEKDLNWPEIWKKLTVVFKKNDRFDDYVPPYQNLGAVLLQVGF